MADKDTILLVALYDGNDNRIFTMEYAPQLQRAQSSGSGNAEEEEAEGGRNRNRIKASDSLSDNTLSGSNLPDMNRQTESGDTTEGTGETDGTESGRFLKGAKAFWYGILCQTADIFLPAPTPFKAWLHDTMGFTDGLDLLFTEEVYEVELAESNLTLNEAESPFALIEHVFAGTNQQAMAADAYRQVTYLNDITYENAQVLMEYATNGGLGTTKTAYSFGVQRESFIQTDSGANTGAVLGGLTYQTGGTYYYTGTGSVANVTGSATNVSYAYTIGGSMTAYAMTVTSDNGTASTLTTDSTAYGTYGVYGYNGEYTHTNLGLQYLRARYLNVATGTFTSKDTYAGRMQDILSQNRYTYAENNPVSNSDPSGHKVRPSVLDILARPMSDITKQSTQERALSATANAVSNYVREQRNRIAQEESNRNFINSVRNLAYKETEVRMNMWRFNMTGVAVMTANPGMVPWIESTAMELEKANCAAYDYCINELQKAIKGKDAGRIAYGSGLILEGIGKAYGASGLAKASTMVSSTGVGTAIGIGRFAASAWLMTCASADITHEAFCQVFF